MYQNWNIKVLNVMSTPIKNGLEDDARNMTNCFSPSSALTDTKGCPSRFRMPFSYVSPVTLDAPSLILPFGFKWMLSDFSPQTAAICTISEVRWNPVVSKSKYVKELLSGDGFNGTMVIYPPNQQHHHPCLFWTCMYHPLYI